MLVRWATALKGGGALSGRKKHNSAHLKHNGEGMKVKAWPNEAAVGYQNRREMEDKG